MGCSGSTPARSAYVNAVALPPNGSNLVSGVPTYPPRGGAPHPQQPYGVPQQPSYGGVAAYPVAVNAPVVQSAPPTGYAPAMLPESDDGAVLERDREPMLLLDRTGSMLWPTSPLNAQPRLVTVRDALKRIVPRLAVHDSTGKDEEGGGGLRTVTFAGGHAEDIGDVTASNLDSKFEAIRWAGTTQLVAGWQKLLDVYLEEFGSRPFGERPLLMAIVITDGEALDTAQFCHAMVNLPRDVYVVLGVTGFGAEHDNAMRAYAAVAAQQPRMTAVPLLGDSSAAIADTLVRMATAPCTATTWLPSGGAAPQQYPLAPPQQYQQPPPQPYQPQQYQPQQYQPQYQPQPLQPQVYRGF